MRHPGSTRAYSALAASPSLVRTVSTHPNHDDVFGLWSGIIPEHLTTRKALRRIHEGGRRSGRRSSHGLWPSRSYNAGRAGLVDEWLCTRRAVMVLWFYVWLKSFHAYTRFIRWDFPWVGRPSGARWSGPARGLARWLYNKRSTHTQAWTSREKSSSQHIHKSTCHTSFRRAPVICLLVLLWGTISPTAVCPRVCPQLSLVVNDVPTVEPVNATPATLPPAPHTLTSSWAPTKLKKGINQTPAILHLDPWERAGECMATCAQTWAVSSQLPPLPSAVFACIHQIQVWRCACMHQSVCMRTRMHSVNLNLSISLALSLSAVKPAAW